VVAVFLYSLSRYPELAPALTGHEHEHEEAFAATPAE
jgi:hypothetical protein